MEKHSFSRLSYLFAHLHLLSSDLFSSDSSHLCFSTVHSVGSFTSKLPSINININQQLWGGPSGDDVFLSIAAGECSDENKMGSGDVRENKGHIPTCETYFPWRKYLVAKVLSLNLLKSCIKGVHK